MDWNTCKRALALVLVSGFVAGAAAKDTVYYVAPNGNDSWSGQIKSPARNRQDGPLATVSAALGRARQLGTERGKVEVRLRGGIYPLAAPLLLTPQDSGLTSEKALIISAYSDEKPVLSGATQITGWQPVPGKANFWQATVPDVREGRWYFHQLFVNGQRRQRARTEGFFRIQGATPEGKPAKFAFHPGDIKKEWAQQGDVEVVALLAWADFRLFIRDVDDKNNTVTLSDAAAPSNREENARYYVENTHDALDQPGEWYLDRKTGVVTYFAETGEDMTHAVVTAPRLHQLLGITGDPAHPVHDVLLKGLSFQGTDWEMGPNGYVDTQAAFAVPAAVQAKWAVNVALVDCVFSHLGGHAIDLGRGCQHDWVVGCDMFDLGGGGIRIGEPEVQNAPADRNNHHVITDNHIHQLGRVFAPAVGVFVLQSGQNRIAHNHIHDLYYTAISVGWTWGYQLTPCRENIIEFNHLHDIGQRNLSDMGGVYTLGPQDGTIVRNNVIHDIDSFTYGGWGLYTDEGSTGIVLESNIVYRCKSAGFHQHYGKENFIRNNIFAFNKENQIMRTRAEDHRSFSFTRNIVYYDSGNLLGSNWSGDQFKMEDNLYYDIRRNGTPHDFGGATLAEWHKRGHDEHSLFLDPLFVDAKKGDFRLRRNSPAFLIGFKQIDTRDVGVRKPGHRD